MLGRAFLQLLYRLLFGLWSSLSHVAIVEYLYIYHIISVLSASCAFLIYHHLYRNSCNSKVKDSIQGYISYFQFKVMSVIVQFKVISVIVHGNGNLCNTYSFKWFICRLDGMMTGLQSVHWADCILTCQ